MNASHHRIKKLTQGKLRLFKKPSLVRTEGSPSRFLSSLLFLPSRHLRSTMPDPVPPPIMPQDEMTKLARDLVGPLVLGALLNVWLVRDRPTISFKRLDSKPYFYAKVWCILDASSDVLSPCSKVCASWRDFGD